MHGTNYQVGTARIDITPDFPVRLSGYGVRRLESGGIEQRIWAKAVAISSDGESPAVLMTVENCGVPAAMTEEIGEALNQKAGISRERFAVCSTHTHSAPCLSGLLPTLFGEPIPDEHQVNIDRYTHDLKSKLKEVALTALADLRPATLAWGEGTVGFASNRRTPGGPVDHAMPCSAQWMPTANSGQSSLATLAIARPSEATSTRSVATGRGMHKPTLKPTTPARLVWWRSAAQGMQTPHRVAD